MASNLRSFLVAPSVLSLLACAHDAPPPASPAPPPPAPCVVAPPPVAPPEPPAAPPPFDPSPWLADLDSLVSELSSHYANLEWAVSERHMDLAALRAKTEARLRDAKSDDDAKRAIQSFLDAFGDGHLSIRWASHGASDAKDANGGAATSVKPLCERLGYGQPAKPGVDFSLASGFAPLFDDDAAIFPGGILTLKSGTKVGTIRIGIFVGEPFPALCEAARRELKLADDATCEGECQDRVTLNVENRMTAALERRAKALVKAGARGIVVDITQNGGGSDWADVAARTLTPVKLRAARMGFVRHAHWVKHFQGELKDIVADRATHADDPVLAAAETTAKAALAEASTPCDRSALWDPSKPKPACTTLVTSRIYTSGLLPYAKPGAFAGLHSSDALFGPGDYYTYREGAVSVPLVVVVDGSTASASEQFASMLVDNRAATVVGSLTTGSGCGFTNGGIPTTLPHSGASVHMPDCARLRANGANEVSGLVPDVLLPFAGRDSPYQRAAKVVAGIEAAMAKGGKRP